MKHNKKEVVIEFNLPDFKRSDIKLNIKKNSILISASKKLEKEIQRKDFFHSERSARTFNYKTTTPSINSSKAKVSFKNGVLKIVAPRLE